MRMRPLRIIAFSLLVTALLALVTILTCAGTLIGAALGATVAGATSRLRARRRTADATRRHQAELVAAFGHGWNARTMPPR